MENQVNSAEKSKKTANGSIPAPLPKTESSKTPSISSTEIGPIENIKDDVLMKDLGLTRDALNATKKRLFKVLEVKELLYTNWATKTGRKLATTIAKEFLADDPKFGMGWKDSDINQETWPGVHLKRLREMIRRVSQDWKRQHPQSSPATKQAVESKPGKSNGTTGTTAPQLIKASAQLRESTHEQPQPEENTAQHNKSITALDNFNHTTSTPNHGDDANDTATVDSPRENSADIANPSTENDRDSAPYDHLEEESMSENESMEKTTITKPKSAAVSKATSINLNSPPAVKRRRLNSVTPEPGRTEERGLSNHISNGSSGFSRLTATLGLDDFPPMLIIKSQIGHFRHDYLPLNEILDEKTGEPSLKQLLNRLQNGPVKFEDSEQVITWRSSTNIRLAIHNVFHFRTAVEQQLFSRREVRLLIETLNNPDNPHNHTISNTFAEL